jgi:hypothetical protein
METSLTSVLYTFSLGALAAAAGEALKLYEYRGRLSSVKYRALLRSGLFWGVFFAMVLASGFIAWAVNANSPEATPLQIVFTGLGARAIARGAAAGHSANRSVTLGSEDRLRLSDLLI